MTRAINNKKNIAASKNQRLTKGFTLIEIALILLIIGIFVGIGTGMIASLLKGNRLNETRQVVKNAKDALIGYAIRNNRLPCPDTFDDSNYDGNEDCPYSPPGPTYKNTKLPYVTMVIRGKDAYLQQLYYDVNDTTTVNTETLTTSSDGYTFCAILKQISGDPRITQDGGSSYSDTASLILSSSENRVLDADINDEDTLRDYETKGITTDFDDIVEWLNPNILLAKRGCQEDCSSYTVYSTGSNVYVRGGTYGTCKQIVDGYMFNVRPGDLVSVYTNSGCSTFKGSVTYPASQTADNDMDCQVQGTGATFTISDY